MMSDQKRRCGETPDESTHLSIHWVSVEVQCAYHSTLCTETSPRPYTQSVLISITKAQDISLVTFSFCTGTSAVPPRQNPSIHSFNPFFLSFFFYHPSNRNGVAFIPPCLACNKKYFILNILYFFFMTCYIYT